MGITKTKGHSKEIINKSRLLKALGHPARLTIITMLLKHASCMTKSIEENLQLSQTTIHQHLIELKNVGLIKGNIEGKNICYCIDAKKWKEVQAYIRDISIKVNMEDKNKENLNC